MNQTNNCTVTQSNTNNGGNAAANQDDSTNNFPGALTSSSVSNGGESSAQTHVKLLQDGNGVEINKQGNEPIDIREIKSSNNDNGIEIQQQTTEESHDLTVQEKLTKLKIQWLSQLP